MSDPKRATLITVGAPKSAKNNVNKTVRLTINLDESNESKYPELNYKELVIAEEKKKPVENGKTTGLDPFSDNEDDDVKRVARKFEQKYGGKNTYRKKGRSKHDDFADIGAGYDENDSFIDNTDGYDEMIPPECDTLYGGFYINSGSLEFKTVPENTSPGSDVETGTRRNKRRISSSSSEEDSSDTSSESSQDEKDIKAIANGAVDSHKTEHRKKKNKKIDKKAKKVRRNDSSAATSGKQTSDDNGQGYLESADSRTSQSDSVTSKPAPSSENAITSDSSRDVEAKVESKLPLPVLQALEALESAVARLLMDSPSTPAKELLNKMDHLILRLDRVVPKSQGRVSRSAWSRAARALGVSRSELQARTTTGRQDDTPQDTQTTTTNIAQSTTANTSTHKRKAVDDIEETNFQQLTDDEREAKIVETLERLKALIEDRKPAMIANYNAECERVQEERKKLLIASAAVGQPAVEKRLPKRRFPWCARARGLLSRLRALATSTATEGAGERAAAALLAKRVLPLFPTGFVRMPTLLRQADLSKEIKATEMKRQRLGSSSMPAMPQTTQTMQFTEPIQFPSSLTVTTTTKSSPEKMEVVIGTDDNKIKTNTVLNTIMSSFAISKDLIVEKPDKKDDKLKEDLYIPPNIGSITITPVPNNQTKEKKPNNVNDKHSGFIRVKSPAALNEMVNKNNKEKQKKTEKNHIKEKRVDLPLHIDTSYQSSKKEPSPKLIKDDITQKQIESMRAAENNIPRPALVPVHHSPTFAKPDKRPPEVKKKKDLVIVSDVDPLSDVVIQEPVSVDDSSSDVEVIEESKVTDNSELKRSDNKCETVPLKDKSVRVDSLQKKVNNVKSKDRVVKDGKPPREDEATDADIDTLMKSIREMERRQKNCRKDRAVTDGKPRRDDEATDEDIDTLMKNIREMENSQEPTKLNSNSFGAVISNAQKELL